MSSKSILKRYVFWLSYYIVYCVILTDFTHLTLNRMAAISETAFSNAFTWMESFAFRLKFYWSLLPSVQLTISPCWFRQWLGAELATIHYLNQCLPSSLTPICGARGRWVNLRGHCIQGSVWIRSHTRLNAHIALKFGRRLYVLLSIWIWCASIAAHIPW